MDDSLLCREEGFRAFVKSAGRGVHNPYPVNSPEHQQFSLGWQHATRLCGHNRPASPRTTTAPPAITRSAKPRHP